jgi:energy-coupling factor transporter ATP-binding protein EcfA2
MGGVFLTGITLSSGYIPLEKNQVLCLVGPNSSGKSSLLNALKSAARGEGITKKSQFREINIGTDFHRIEEILACRHISIRGQKIIWPGGAQKFGENIETWLGRWVENQGCEGILRQAFIQYMDAHNRFSAVSDAQQIDVFSDSPTHPFHILYKEPELEDELAKVSQELFGKSTVLNPGAGKNLVLHFGESIDSSRFGGNRDQKYANEVARLPRIEEEGDGVKATIGLLARVISGDYSCILIDEPDLYLHPPQAHALARILVREKRDAQFIFATHSARFLQGLFAEAPDRLKLLRLFKSEDEYSYGEVDNSVFKEIQNDPLLSFTNIIESVFYDFCFLCEDNSDCFFFKTAMERSGGLKTTDSSIWIGVQGKQNIAKIAKIARSLQVKPICILDFDVLSPKNDSLTRVLQPIVSALGGESSAFAERIKKQLHTAVENNSNLTWNQLKASGEHALESDQHLYSQVKAILSDLRELGLFVLPSGELESLHTPKHSAHGIEAAIDMLDKSLESREMRKAKEAIKLLTEMVNSQR